MKYYLIVVFLVYSLLLTIFSKAGLPNLGNNENWFPYLLERPITEDGFYSIKTAWNIGHGNGVTYNFNKPVTGIQPLYVFLLSGFSYCIATFDLDKFAFLRMILFFSCITLIFFSLIIYKISTYIYQNKNKREQLIVSVLLVLFNFKVFLNFFNGLETGIYLVLIGLNIIFIFKIDFIAKSKKDIFIFGILIGLTLLARLDSLIIILTVLFMLIRLKKIKIYDLIFIVIVACFITSPWLIYVYSIQGNFIPTSVAVQTGISFYEWTYRLDQFAYSISTNFIPFFHVGLTQTLFQYLFLVSLIFIIYKFQIVREIKKILTISFNVQIWLIAFTLCSFIYLIFAAEPSFYFRYLAIFLTISLPLICVLIFKGFEKVRFKYFNYFITLFVAYFFINIIYYFHFPKNNHGLATRPMYVKQHFSSNAIIGMPQSGISGFIFDNVINLDGKVNFDALEAINKNRLLEYIDKSKIDVLIEWNEWFELIPKNYLNENWKLIDNQVEYGKSSVYVKK